MAGVKWVIRLQLVLLMVLCVAILDFFVGSFVRPDPGLYSCHTTYESFNF